MGAITDKGTLIEKATKHEAIASSRRLRSAKNEAERPSIRQILFDSATEPAGGLSNF
jgi:hypothetical protein